MSRKKSEEKEESKKEISSEDYIKVCTELAELKADENARLFRDSLRPYSLEHECCKCGRSDAWGYEYLERAKCGFNQGAYERNLDLSSCWVRPLPSSFYEIYRDIPHIVITCGCGYSFKMKCKDDTGED